MAALTIGSYSQYYQFLKTHSTDEEGSELLSMSYSHGFALAIVDFILRY
jgi:hypothetical protein